MTKTEEYDQCRQAIHSYSVKLGDKVRKLDVVNTTRLIRKLTEWRAVLDAKERETA